MGRISTEQMIDTIRKGDPLGHDFLAAVADRLECVNVYSRRALEAENAELKAQIEGVGYQDFIRLRDENERLEHTLSCVADVATGGKLSKTNYPVETYTQAIHEYLCAEREEAFNEGREAVSE